MADDPAAVVDRTPAHRALAHRALAYLSRREHYRAELKAKLLRRKDSCERDVDAVLDRLEVENLLSDTRYIAAFVAYRSGRLYGPVRIRMELLQKKLNAAAIDQALAASRVDWPRNAQRCQRKKFAVPPKDAQDYAKQRDFLWRRGYPPQIIRATLNTSADEEEP